MNNEDKDNFFLYKMLSERLEASEQENKGLKSLICDLRKENKVLKSELRNQSLTRTEMQSGASGECNEYKKRYEELVEVNHEWKKEYDELQLLYQILNYEMKQLESEITGPADGLSAQQRCNSGAKPSEDQCEILKCQMIVYKEDFVLERKDHETLQAEMAKYQQKHEDMEEIIKKLTTELDARTTLEESAREIHVRTESAYRSGNGETPRYQIRIIHPYHPADEIYQLEEDIGILPRYCQKISMFYRAEPGYPEEL